MCLALLAYHVHPRYPFVFAANRDEFFDRPTQSADIWEDHPMVVGGRDLKEGGSWLGMAKNGRFAAITNIRDPVNHRSDAPSRGKLVLDFLTTEEKTEDFLARLEVEGHRYNGFNLIFGTFNELLYFSNRLGSMPIEEGLHGLSNAFLDTPWPKVERGKELMKKILEKDPAEWKRKLFHLLADRKVPPDEKLPRTGVGVEWERLLAPIFITSPIYGTRSSTVIIVDREEGVSFEEWTYDGQMSPWMKVAIKIPLLE
ncbi:MAG: NRDE family protein [Syntrophales bacterium]|nr:NRDE family protein [Syntrophales bacterium]